MPVDQLNLGLALPVGVLLALLLVSSSPDDCSVAGFGASALVYPPNGSAFAATV